jgi:hypothetical protein
MRAIFAALLCAAVSIVAFAREPAMPGAPDSVSARFPYQSPAAVVVDVFEVGGMQIGTDVSASQVSLDGSPSDVWQLDLSAVTDFAPDCDERAYVVRFVPDSADCTPTGQPEDCAEDLVQSGGWLCRQEDQHDEVVVYPTLPIPARGITSAVISRGNPSYIRHDVRQDGGEVVFSYYTVFHYDSSGRVSQKLRSLTPPSP